MNHIHESRRAFVARSAATLAASIAGAPPRPRRQQDRGDVGEEAGMIVSVSRRSHYLMKHTHSVACILLKLA
jgi:hypothetical protein